MGTPSPGLGHQGLFSVCQVLFGDMRVVASGVIWALTYPKFCNCYFIGPSSMAKKGPKGQTWATSAQILQPGHPPRSENSFPEVTTLSRFFVRNVGYKNHPVLSYYRERWWGPETQLKSQSKYAQIPFSFPHRLSVSCTGLKWALHSQ